MRDTGLPGRKRVEEEVKNSLGESSAIRERDNRCRCTAGPKRASREGV